MDVVELLLDYGASVNAPFPNSRLGKQSAKLDKYNYNELQDTVVVVIIIIIIIIINRQAFLWSRAFLGKENDFKENELY